MNELLTKELDVEIIKSTHDEIEFLASLGEDYIKYSEMSNQDRLFLSTLIQREKPKKILELGVSKGGSSFIILNAIMNMDSHLFSIDYNENHYRIKSKKTGFYLDDYPKLREKWTLKTGGLALNFLDEIGNDIDFCLIDTVHSNPGEILDFLMVLPYLKEDSIILFHDTNLHFLRGKKSSQYTNNILMSAILGEKIIPSINPYSGLNQTSINNVGAIRINKNTFKNVYEIFNLLTHRWQYELPDKDLEQLIHFFKRFYNEYYINYFKEVIAGQKYLKNSKNKNKIYKIKKMTILKLLLRELINLF